MSLLLPMTPLSIVVDVHKLPIWMLLAAAASSWLVPTVVAAGDVDEAREESTAEHHVVVDCESTVAGASEFAYDDSIADDDETDEDEEILVEDDDEEEENDDEYSPVGLQYWPDVDSLLRALYGGRLVLVIILASWCDNGQNSMRDSAALAAELLDETFIPPLWESDADGLPLAELWYKPLIGIMDSISTSDDERMEIFGNVTQYPALKFVMTPPPSLYGKAQNFRRESKKEEAPDAHGEIIFPDIYTEEMAGVSDQIIPDVPSEEEVLEWGDDDFDCHVQIWDFIGTKVTPTDLYDSVMMYWYRTFLSIIIGGYVEPSKDNPDNAREFKPPYFTFSPHRNLTKFLQDHGNFILRPAKARRRHASKLESEVFNFYMGMDEGSDGVGGIYRPFEFLDDDTALRLNEDNDTRERKAFTHEIDPYVLVVQCRARINHGEIRHDKMTIDEITILANQIRAINDFDDLAVEMVHRMDVAFFALDATNYEGKTDNIGKVCGGLFGEINGSLNGAVAFVRIRRYVDYSFSYEPASDHLEEQNRQQRWHHNVRTDWDENNSLVPNGIFVPAVTGYIPEEQKQIYGKTVVKDPTISIEYVHSNLVASTVIHVTPTVIWFDKEWMSQLAFPWYRKVHAVLFVDMGLAHKISRPNSIDRTSWPSSLDYSKESRTLLLSQRAAIRMFYQSALRHRRDRPSDDVVFLVVPSSEVRIMTSFGIDIWTPLDEALFGTLYEDKSNGLGEDFGQSNSGNGICSTPVNVESKSILPMMMITDSSGRSGMQSSRYYMCADDIASSRMTDKDGGAIGDFIDKFFSGTIGKPFVRSDTPSSTSRSTAQGMQNSNKPNVTVITGNTFESLVMDRYHEHTMLLMQTTTCGHCKRFSIFWNELSSLVQAMNWSSVISVMKIDVTKNDVPHSKINAWDLPSVYYFPANQKDEPIELPAPTLPQSNPQHSYDEGLSWVTSGYDLVKWMIDQGKLDLDLLSRLDGSSADGDAD